MKNKVEIKQVISDLKELFGYDEKCNDVIVNGNKFLINKQKFERFQVIEMLQGYFSDKVVNGGYLQVGSITFVYTDFEIFEGNPK